jgi:negative regulator of sigma E activity
VNLDDETLMAYADGELDAAQRAEIAAALGKDPALAARVDRHRALRAEVAAAFEPVLSQPVPEKLRAAATTTATATPGRARGNVVPFPTRAARAPATPWRAREWLAMAASVLLGVVISWRAWSPVDTATISAEHGALVARGMLAAALDRQLAGNQPNDAAVKIGLTFKARDGSYCRSFALRDAGITGLACRADDEWRIPVTATADAAGGDIRQAASSIPPAVMQAIEARIAGDAGWK